MSIFTGSCVALVTPFKPDGSVNFEKLIELTDYHLAHKTDALLICGTTGEASTISDEDQVECVRLVAEHVNKKIPVIAGAGSNDTAHAVELGVACEKAGADALLLVTPYYNKTTQKGLVSHYSKIAESVDIPIILYNVPSRTGVNIEPKTCLELSKIPNIVAIKEASGNISQVAKIANLCKDDLYIYSGNDDQILPILSLGGLGVISVLSNIYPRFVHNMVMDYLTGNWQKATASQIYAIPLINALFSEVNPIPVKYALNRIGFNCGKPRLPLIELSDENKEVLNQLLRDNSVFI